MAASPQHIQTLQRSEYKHDIHGKRKRKPAVIVLLSDDDDDQVPIETTTQHVQTPSSRAPFLSRPRSDTSKHQHRKRSRMTSPVNAATARPPSIAEHQEHAQETSSSETESSESEPADALLERDMWLTAKRQLDLDDAYAAQADMASEPTAPETLEPRPSTRDSRAPAQHPRLSSSCPAPKTLELLPSTPARAEHQAESDFQPVAQSPDCAETLEPWPSTPTHPEHQAESDFHPVAQGLDYAAAAADEPVGELAPGPAETVASEAMAMLVSQGPEPLDVDDSVLRLNQTLSEPVAAPAGESADADAADDGVVMATSLPPAPTESESPLPDEECYASGEAGGEGVGVDPHPAQAQGISFVARVGRFLRSAPVVISGAVATGVGLHMALSNPDVAIEETIAAAASTVVNNVGHFFGGGM